MVAGPGGGSGRWSGNFPEGRELPEFPKVFGYASGSGVSSIALALALWSQRFCLAVPYRHLDLRRVKRVLLFLSWSRAHTPASLKSTRRCASGRCAASPVALGSQRAAFGFQRAVDEARSPAESWLAHGRRRRVPPPTSAPSFPRALSFPVRRTRLLARRSWPVLSWSD